MTMSRMLLRGSVPVSTEVKFPGPSQIPFARKKRCEYSSHNVLLVILHKDNLMTCSLWHMHFSFSIFIQHLLGVRGTACFGCLCSIVKNEKKVRNYRNFFLGDRSLLNTKKKSKKKNSNIARFYLLISILPFNICRRKI